MSIKKLALIFLSFTLLTSTSWSNPIKFSQILDRIEEQLVKVSDPDLNSAALSTALNVIYASAYDLDFKTLNLDDLKIDADAYINRLFQIQTKLQSDLLTSWNNKGLLENSATLEAYYKILRTIRYTIDFIGEAKFGFPRIEKGDKPSTSFVNGEFSMVLGGNADELPSGTLYLVRGSAANSAAIARISSLSDGQFSHIGILHQDRDGERSILEALIEKGLVKNSYDYAMNAGVVRAQTFIYEDPEFFKEVAALSNVHASSDVHVPYNFRMIPLTIQQDPYTNGYFCSDNIAHNALVVSNGEFSMPMHPSTIPTNDFTWSLGVRTETTFAPSDIQSDSRFSPGPEWRDFKFTEKVRQQDLILDHIFKAIDSGWFKFVPGKKYKIGASIAKFLSQFPGIRKISLLRNIPKNMSKETLRYVLMLHFATEKIHKIVIQANNAHLRSWGYPLSPKKTDDLISQLFLHHSAFGALTKVNDNLTTSGVERILMQRDTFFGSNEKAKQCIDLIR